MEKISPVKDGVVLPEVVEGIGRFLDEKGLLSLLLAEEGPHLEGVWGGSAAGVAAAIVQRLPDWNIVVLAPSQKSAEDFHEDFTLFSRETPLFFPWIPDVGEKPQEPTEWETFLPSAAIGERLRVLKTLQNAGVGGKRAIVMAPIQALLKPCPPKESLQQDSLSIACGETFSLDFLTGWLVDHGFQSTSAVQFPGEFFVRGGLLDIYGMEMDVPVRVEFFGDEVESIRTFDLETQRSLERLSQVEITSFLTMFRETDKEEKVGLTSYLPRQSLFLLWDSEDTVLQGKRFYQAQEKPEKLLTPEEVFRAVMKFPFLSMATLGRGAVGPQFSLATETVERFSGDFSKVREELEKFSDGQDVFLLCPHEAEETRLRMLLENTRPAREKKLHLRIGTLSEGFRLVESRMLVLTSDAMFQRTEVRRSSHRKTTKVIDSFSELSEGDYVVHVSHGIAVYRGLKLLETQTQKKSTHGGAEEHLVLEFSDHVLVYVPVSKIALVQKYINGGGVAPKLSTYGGKTWESQKRAVSEAVLDLAVEMLEMQAVRQARPGIAFPIETPLQKDFDALFPYTETPDQQSAMEAIRKDMTQPRPMDRLLCGDVGFGKTEVAMRAAFTAVEAGYQVAVMVPTTILAEQHLRTFSQRMAPFPVLVESLSRFSTPAQQKETLARLQNGTVDIVIGTHRLVSRDVHFQNLGLVIIDEEQRFGVEVKEALKRFRRTVDVLTMTATPIPRTLHMSLLGIRDISSLETPPGERMAVETHVTRFQDSLVQNAIRREIERDGQIFFIHNRVHDIEETAERLQSLVPEARIRIGHAQMSERSLEKVMLDFVSHRCDVLVSTTIVENGVDIPNANTIFIDEADRYGLSDLHQLRGRVGRFRNHAYCYLLVKENANLTPDGIRRLKAIEEFSHLGSGFHIAMRDLVIRGTGNILGTRQSGQIAMVGYEMYCDMLENAVRKLKKVPPREKVEVEVDLPVTAYIPHDYVPDMRVKMELYRRLSRFTTLAQIEDFVREMKDRFGRIPAPFWRLLKIYRIRILAHPWLIYAIRREENYLVVHFYSSKAIEPLTRRTVGRKKARLRIADSQSAYLPLDEKTAQSPPDSDFLLKYVELLLRER
ncbi:MAG: transcription-repair coupling factor [Planctomycetia bacterium]|nr:transcription-repair coupling factor [Planctomycetia bacterium]